jgi:hypothetical protein
VHERNQEVVLVVGMGLVIILAFVTALFCYLGLSNAKDLPNGLTFFTGFFAMAVPILLRAAFRRGAPPGRGRGRGQPRTTTTVAGLPPPGPMPPPPTSATLRDTIPRR